MEYVDRYVEVIESIHNSGGELFQEVDHIKSIVQFLIFFVKIQSKFEKYLALTQQTRRTMKEGGHLVGFRHPPKLR